MPDIYMDVDTALAEVPVNVFPLTDDTDFKTREVDIAYNAAGMDLVWNFTTTAGAFTQTAVTPTTGGAYDWTHQGDGMYTIEIPASGGATINNDTEGFGWFSGIATGVLPWRGPIIGFRASGINDKMIDSAYSATRGLSGTALPDAVSDAAGGLPISDAGGLDLDTLLATLTNGTYGLSAIETLVDDIESRLTATRAGYLDNLSAGAVATASALSTVSGLVDDLESRLTAARAGYLDELGAANIPADIDTLIARLTSARAGYIDNLSSGAVALASVCTEARLAELGAANLPSDIDTLIARLTALRAGYLDNLSGGAAALQSSVDDLEGRLTATRAGYLDQINSIYAKLPSKNYLAGTSNADGDIQADEATGNFAGSVGSVSGAVASVTAGVTVTTNNDKTGYSLSSAPPAASAIADAVWDEAISGHLSAGTTGAALNAAGSAGDPWVTPIPGAYGAGTAGNILGNLNDISTVEAQAAASAAITAYDPPTKAELDSAVSPLATAAALATVDGIVDAIVEDTGTTIPAQISGLNNLSSAQVTTAVDTALGTTVSEPTGISDKSVKGLLWHLFARFYHKNTQTASEQVTYKANSTSELATRAASDDGTTQTLGKAE